MAKFLNTSGAYAEIEGIIDKAKSRLVLISPYIKIPELLLERLKYVDKKNILIILVCRKDKLTDDEKSKLKQLKNLELRFDEHLHAKCFYNEESMVITSLNLYEYSQQHNKEMGILLTLKDDHDIFNEARKEAKFIVGRAEKDSLIRSSFSRVMKETKSIVTSAMKDEPIRPKSKPYSYRKKPTSRAKQSGYCIRCKKSIPYNLDRPLCDEHFEVWAQHKDPDYPEKYCHTCGKRARTTKSMPQCRSCYAKSQR